MARVQAFLFLPGAIIGGVFGWFLIRPINWLLGMIFRGFNWVFDRLTAVYGQTVGWSIRLCVIVLVVYVGLIGLTGVRCTRVALELLPTHDKVTLVGKIPLPDSA